MTKIQRTEEEYQSSKDFINHLNQNSKDIRKEIMRLTDERLKLSSRISF